APGGRSPSNVRARAGRATAITSTPGCDAYASGRDVTTTSTAPASGSTTQAPVRQTANAQTTVRQCGGRSTRTRVCGPTSYSSTSRLVDLVTQLSSTWPDSSMRSPSGPYQVRRGWPGSATRPRRRWGRGTADEADGTRPAYEARPPAPGAGDAG